MKEDEIRPKALFAEYLRLSAADADILFEPARRSKILCPGCGGQDHRPAFVKHGF